jgi:hypothetical protein
MALPLSRNTTYALGIKILSADLNSIQDCIIGGKFGPTDIEIGGANFNLMNPNYAATVPSFGDDWQFTGVTPPNDNIVTGIVLPIGTQVNSITWHFNKASQASALTMRLRKRNGTTNTDIDVLADVTSGAAQTSVTQSAATFSGVPNYQVLPGDALQLRVTMGHASHRFSHLFMNIQRI